MPCRRLFLNMTQPVLNTICSASFISQMEAKTLVLDCRSATKYIGGHIRGSFNLTLPTLLLRRLSAGKMLVESVFKCPKAKERFVRTKDSKTPVILYDDLGGSPTQRTPGSLLSILYRRLREEGCNVLCLKDSYQDFLDQFPEWCQTYREDDEGEPPVLGLQSLRISLEAPGDRERCDSLLTPSPLSDPSFPVEILPQLFLGNAHNSADEDALRKHDIKYILNVTPDLPNVFEAVEGYRYLQLPISDHLSQDLSAFIPEAIAFIEEARGQQLGVLVHCVAGLSRSVAVTVAYLMQKLSLSLNDAYDLVRQRKHNISPNLSFLGQLLELERSLCLTGKNRSTVGTSPTCHPSPDSGIDFDHWS